MSVTARPLGPGGPGGPGGPASPGPRPARRGLWWTGVALVLAGLVVLGYVGWSFFGSTWVSHRKHEQIVTSLEQRWSNGESFVRTDEGRADAVVRIPRLGTAYAVPLLEGIEDDALAAGIGHFPGSADPGAVGNVALAGHRVTHGEPLRDLPLLEVGDRVIVETATTSFTYELLTGGDDLTVPFTDTWVVDPRPVNPDGGVTPDLEGRDRLLTLTTCSELFHTDDRLVAFARLVDRSPRTT